MLRPLELLIERLEGATTLDDLQAEVVALRDLYGIDHIGYVWVSSAGDHYGCGTYSMEWRQRYLDKGYMRVDPVILGTFNRFHPVDWRELDWSGRQARAFLKDAQAHGVGDHGLAIPVRGPAGQFALFTASHSCDDAWWDAFVAENRRDLILVSHFFNQKALQFEGARMSEAGALSPREIEAMTALALGQSRAQAAEGLGISESTLRVYIESARHKLGALNTTHAVARAMNQGLIVVEDARQVKTRGGGPVHVGLGEGVGDDPEKPAPDSKPIH